MLLAACCVPTRLAPALISLLACTQSVFADITNSMAFNSLILGELPDLTHHQADNFLAEFGLLGAVYNYDDEKLADYDRCGTEAR